MNRNSFIKNVTAAGTFFITPLIALAKITGISRINKGLLVKSGTDRSDKPIALFEGDTFYSKVSSRDSDGDIFVFESTRVKEGGPSYHYHYDQDEYWYVLQGEFIFKIADETFTAKAGDSVYGPRMVPHSFSKVGEGEAKLLMFYQPAGKMEEMFTKIGQGKAKNLNEEEQQKFMHEHGIKRVGPPLKQVKKW